MQGTALAIQSSAELITPAVDPAAYLKPIANVQQIMERQKMLAEIVSKYLIEAKSDQWGNVDMDGADYGLLPGTKTRMLFQPGAEKLALAFGLSVTAYCVEKKEDWEKGFFHYTFKAVASYMGQTIREVTRSCGTNEKKYAWIWVNRQKPSEEAIQQMIEEQVGRWGTKWEKQNGRNVKMTVWQERKPNPDPFSLQFVVEAMAQKRAKVAVVKEALAATGYFSAKEIDFEDIAEAAAPAPERKSNSGKLSQSGDDAPTAKTPLGKQILALKDTLGITDADFLQLILSETELDAPTPLEAADGISEAEQKLIVENLKDRLKK